MGCTISREPGRCDIAQAEHPVGERINDTSRSSPTPPVQLQQLSQMRTPRCATGDEESYFKETPASDAR